MHERHCLLCAGTLLCFVAVSAANHAAAQQPAQVESSAPSTPTASAAVQQQPSFPASAIGVPMTPFTLPAKPQTGDTPAISEDELRRQLAGKTFYLRGGYLDNSLHFNARGGLEGNSPKASHTLSLVEIDHVRLDKHRLELEGVRYGLHFLGALPTEDQTQAVDKVRLTSKKKPLRIAIDREQVIKPKKQKESKAHKHGAEPAANSPQVAAPAAVEATPSEPAPAQSGESPTGLAGAVQNKPTDSASNGPVTVSQAHANQMLIDALDHIFAAGMDDRLLATLPDYWQLFYKSVTEHHDYRPADPAILRQAQVSQKAKLLSAFEPPSNEFAQNNGVAGMAMYHVIVGPDGKPLEVAVGRPIGFGLDENAVDAIRKASFQSAMKDGAPVPVVLDLVVQFRIFSKRTGVTSAAAANSAEPAAASPALPGPYTANRSQAAAQQQSAPQPQ